MRLQVFESPQARRGLESLARNFRLTVCPVSAKAQSRVPTRLLR